MARKPKPKPDDKEQSQRFVETARDLGATDQTGFDKALDVLLDNAVKGKDTVSKNRSKKFQSNDMRLTENVIAAFSEDQTERLTGVTKSQLRYWDNTNFDKPSYAEDNRRVSFSRIYSFKDIVALRILNVLRNQYSVSLPHLRQVSERLNHLEADPDRWIKSDLYVLNRRVVSDTKRDIAKSKVSRDQTKVGKIEKSRYINHNLPVIAGTRIPVNSIKRFSEAGYSSEQILKEYPDLTIQDINAALEYKNASQAN